MLPPVASRVLSEHVLRMFFLVAVVFGLASLGKLPQRTMSSWLHLLYSLYTNRLVRFVGRKLGKVPASKKASAFALYLVATITMVFSF